MEPNIYPLITDLLNILGLQTKDNRIYDTDTFTFLVYNGGFLYIPSSAGAIQHKKDTEFNPVKNIKLSKYLFNMLLTKESEDNSLYVNSFGSAPQSSNMPTKYRLEVSTNNGHFQSDYYFLESLQYIQMMFMITGTPLPLDLKQFDFTREQILENNSKR